jgi:hypothetical protein
MAPSDIDSLKQKADELDQQLEKLTDKMEEIITAQSQALDNRTSVLMSSAISKPCRPSSVLTLFVLAPCPMTWVFSLPVKFFVLP